MIDFACRHIWADSFDCGNSHLNAGLAATLSKLPDPADITVLISHDDDDIVNAYSTVVDVLLKLDEAGRDERCFLVAALGVDRAHQGGSTGAALIAHVLDLLRTYLWYRRLRGTPPPKP